MDGDNVTNATFAQKIKSLQDEMIRMEREAPARGCIPTTVAIAVVIPIFLFMIFWFWTPDILKCTQQGKRVRTGKRVFWGTIIFSMPLWLLLVAVYWFVPSVLCIKF